jgi:hypothetical protein
VKRGEGRREKTGEEGVKKKEPIEWCNGISQTLIHPYSPF